jgi:hypothetical protein
MLIFPGKALLGQRETVPDEQVEVVPSVHLSCERLIEFTLNASSQLEFSWPWSPVE